MPSEAQAGSGAPRNRLRLAVCVAVESVVPVWAIGWCTRELGAAPVEAFPVEAVLAAVGMSDVLAVRLDDGRTVVVKRRENEFGRASSCVAVQRKLAANGFPCARPLTAVTFRDGFAVHAEEWRPGGEVLRGDGPDVAERSATLLADLMTRLSRATASPPLPNPEWVRWGHDGPGVFPANERHDARVPRVPVPAWIDEVARRTRAKLLRPGLPCVVGHADWETQNLRWIGEEPHAVYDWDSLASLPEAAIVGAAAGAFASAEVPTLAPVASSVVFLDTYQRERGRAFNAAELEIAWGASIWPALHNARGEVLHQVGRIAFTALEQQADERLALAGA
jgi:hypothetical protein